MVNPRPAAHRRHETGQLRRHRSPSRQALPRRPVRVAARRARSRPGVREKRGAGAGCTTPSSSTNVRARAIVRMRRRLGERSTGAKQASLPSSSSHHSSRVFVLERAAKPLAQAPATARASCCAGKAAVVEPQALEQLGVELRLDRADRDVLAVRASRRCRRRRRRRRASWRRARRARRPAARMP